MDFAFLRSALRTLRRGRERAGYWCWVWAYRRRYLPQTMEAIAENAPHARVHMLRSQGMVRRFIAGQPGGFGR